jgi:GrpB-like predicted nucleotidyltransferase (UPF0157 family)
MRRIEIVDYDAAWPANFEREAAALTGVFGELLLSLHHIGSTSIPGMRSKPIIDIMPVVDDIEAVDPLTPAMSELGYEGLGENGISGRRYFRKGGDEARSHHVHVYEPGNPEVARHLDFRDYVRAHAEAADTYARLKERLAQEFTTDITAYSEGKSAFIEEMIAKAQAWRLQQKED